MTELSRFSVKAIGFASLLALLAALQLGNISADPPAWVEEAFLIDGGWWGSSARAKAFFGDYFMGDLGAPYLFAPGYTWTLKLIYTQWGVGLSQTRMLSAISNLVILLIVAALAWRMAGKKEAVLATALLGFSPFFWAQGRVGLPEPFQALFIVAAFGLWFGNRLAKTTASCCGIAMTFAIAIKPTALLLGLVPLLLSILAVQWKERFSSHIETETSNNNNTFCRATLAGVGMFASFGVLLLPHFLPNWNSLLALFSSERGIYGMNWAQMLTIPGRALISKEIDAEGGFSPIVWRVAKWSPVLMTCAWFYLLGLAQDSRLHIPHMLHSLSSFEVATIVWVLSMGLIICCYPGQPDYRYVPMLPGLAILGGLHLSRRLSSRSQSVHPASPRPGGLVRAFLFWALMLFPLFLILKPWIARLIMSAGRHLSVGNHPGIEYGAAGALFMLTWSCLILTLALLNKHGERCGAELLSRRNLVLLLPLLLFQYWEFGSYFSSAESTLVKRQAELAQHVHEGDQVVGRLGGTLFLPVPVQTVRRLELHGHMLEMFDSPAKLNLPEAVGSQYTIIPFRFNFRPYQPYQALHTELASTGYELIRRFDVGPTRSNNPRFQFELWRRKPSHLSAR